MLKACAAGLLLVATPLSAQSVNTPAPTATTWTAPDAVSPSAPVFSTATEQAMQCPAIIPAGSPITIAFESALSSKISKQDDMFPITVAEPVKWRDQIVIPVGTPGEGQVIHSAKTGFGGRAGELILAVRYVQMGDQRIALRGLRISRAGRNQSTEALAASVMVPLAGMFITGTNVEVGPGQYGVAKLVASIAVDAPECATNSAPSPVTETTTSTPSTGEQ